MRPKDNTRKEKIVLILRVVTEETEDKIRIKGTGVRHPLFRVGNELLSICSLPYEHQ